MLPDGTVNPGTMTSFNHYALGAIADWLHRTVAGIAPDQPGYRVVRFAPRPGGGITSAQGRHTTPYGDASVEWRLEGDTLVLDVRVPVGTEGIIDIEGHEAERVGHGTHHRTFPLMPEMLLPRHPS